MKKYCVRLYNLNDSSIFSEVIESESVLIAVINIFDIPFRKKYLPELDDVETLGEAIRILENKGFKVEVFRI